MSDVDMMLARLATVPAPRSLRDDPGFVARLEASRGRGEMLGMIRSVALGVVVAGLMVTVHPGPGGRGGGALLSTMGGDTL